MSRPAATGRTELIELLRREIEDRGPITFARFMQRALYEPGLGYYATSDARPTRGGDFLTAPELHPIFGHALARQLDEMWRRLDEPSEFVLREYGAGSGALAASVADGLTQMRSGLRPRLRYQPIELPGRESTIARRLADEGLEDLLRPAEDRLVGCVLANEFLDALPVHRVVWRNGRLRELLVGWAHGGFVEVEAEPSTPDLPRWFEETGVALAEGQRAEASLTLGRWMDETAGALERGYVLLFDYGAEPAALYGPTRPTGTLRAFSRHRVSSDVYGGVGERDITAHVDLGALRRLAERAGFAVLGVTTQAEFLVGCGLEEVLVEAQASLPEEWPPRLELRSAVARLIDPRHLGGYSVVALGKAVAAHPPLRGLAFRLPPRS